MEYSSLQTCLTATVTHVPYRIIQCYLSPKTDDVPTFIPANYSGIKLLEHALTVFIS